MPRNTATSLPVTGSHKCTVSSRDAVTIRDPFGAMRRTLDPRVRPEPTIAGPLYVQGKGAGPLPTASDIISDVMAILEGIHKPECSGGIRSELSQRK